MNGNNGERKTRAAMQFLAWVQDFSPEWHAMIVERVGDAPRAGGLNNLSGAFEMPTGLGQNGVISTTQSTTSADGWDFSWATELISVAKEVATEALPAYYQAKQTIAIADLNLERARQGLPPLDPEATAAQINVTHNLPPSIQAQVDRFGMGGNILLWGAIAVGAFFVVRALR